MKKAAALFALIVILASCNSRYEQDNDDKGNITRKTTEKSPFRDLELEMKGNITFNEDGTAIRGIPHGGYVKYINNEMKMEATPRENNTVAVTVYDNGDKIPVNSDKAKACLEEAIGRMQDLQEKYNRE